MRDNKLLQLPMHAFIYLFYFMPSESNSDPAALSCGHFPGCSSIAQGRAVYLIYSEWLKEFNPLSLVKRNLRSLLIVVYKYLRGEKIPESSGVFRLADEGRWRSWHGQLKSTEFKVEIRLTCVTKRDNLPSSLVASPSLGSLNGTWTAGFLTATV